MSFASETNNWNLGYQQMFTVKSFSYSASIRHNSSGLSTIHPFSRLRLGRAAIAIALTS